MPAGPSVSATGLVMTIMFAPGAIACAHWTSSDVSSAHPTWVQLVSSKGTVPSGDNTCNDGGAASPNPVSNCARSVLTVGLPNESKMTIVWPVPSNPDWSSELTPYAFQISNGE